jgi:Uncharacterized proteins of the AP superfamily
MENGSYTLKKRSVLPSSSAVNWASMFMGAGPELHGYTEWNSSKPDLPSRVILKNNIFPTVFQLFRDAYPNAEIGSIYEWKVTKYYIDSLSFNHCELMENYTKYPDSTSTRMCEYIKEKKPNLAFFCFDNPDVVGHEVGHDTPEYYNVLSQLDKYIGKIIQAIKDAGIYEKSIIIVTSDHGGIKKGHGGKTMMEMETPFIIFGKKVKKGFCFNESMMQFDCASTIAYIFNLKQPQVWIGKPMKQVFK